MGLCCYSSLLFTSSVSPYFMSCLPCSCGVWVRRYLATPVGCPSTGDSLLRKAIIRKDDTAYCAIVSSLKGTSFTNSDAIIAQPAKDVYSIWIITVLGSPTASDLTIESSLCYFFSISSWHSFIVFPLKFPFYLRNALGLRSTKQFFLPSQSFEPLDS